jgi:hypothetical protein
VLTQAASWLCHSGPTPDTPISRFLQHPHLWTEGTPAHLSGCSRASVISRTRSRAPPRRSSPYWGPGPPPPDTRAHAAGLTDPGGQIGVQAAAVAVVGAPLPQPCRGAAPRLCRDAAPAPAGTGPERPPEVAESCPRERRDVHSAPLASVIPSSILRDRYTTQPQGDRRARRHLGVRPKPAARRDVSRVCFLPAAPRS